MKNCLKIVFFLFLMSVFQLSCKDSGSKRSGNLFVRNGWEAQVENVALIEVPIPFLSNIQKISSVGHCLLLHHDKMDSVYSVWNMEPPYNHIRFGQVGNGPSDVLPTSFFIKEHSQNRIRVLDGTSIKSFVMSGDSVYFVESRSCNSRFNFYRSIHAINDSLCLVDISAPHQTGLFLLNIFTREVYDSICVNEGYFDNKCVPHEFNFSVNSDKIVLGRARYDQIEVYRFDQGRLKIIPEYVINYDNASSEKVDKSSACYMHDVVSDETCYYLLNQHTDHPGKQTYLDVYTWSGEPVNRMVLDGLYLHMVMLDNKIYLKKYRDDDCIYMLPLDKLKSK